MAACIIAEPCGVVEGGVALGVGGAATPGGSLAFEGGSVLVTGAAESSGK
jgi:hypothetical protein